MIQSLSSKQPIPLCPVCANNRYVIRYGRRNNAQQYYCKSCNRYFISKSMPHTSYPPKVILTAISTYNLGHTLDDTLKIINRRFKTHLPKSTLHSWLNRYANICTFIPLRKRFTIDPIKVIQSKKFHHVQVYEFQYHTLKLNIAGKRYPKLKQYTQNLPTSLDNKIFQKGPRISILGNVSFNLPQSRPRRITKNNAIRMTQFALELVKKATEKHEKVEEFFLINDSATIAIETPVYITPIEAKSFGLSINQPLTGHIDILQVRQNRVHILDYKPDSRTETKATQQLILYALALNKRTGIPFSDITCAYFDENDYFEVH